MNTLIDNLPCPDVQSLMDLEKSVIHALHATSQVMPAVGERVQDLTDLIKNANKTLRQQVVAGIILLNNELESIQDETDATVQDTDLVQLRSSLLKKLEPFMDITKQIEAFRDPDLVPLRQSAQKSLDIANAAVEQCQLAIGALETTRRDLETRLGLERPPSIGEVLVGQLPTPEQIEAIKETLVSGKVGTGLINEAIKSAKKNFETLGKALDYDKLVSEYTGVNQSLVQAFKDLESLQAAAGVAAKQLAQWGCIGDAFKLREGWLGQATVFTRSWTALTKALKTTSEVKTLLDTLGTARDYLLNVRRGFETAH